MVSKYQESAVKVKETINLEVSQVEYLRTLKNKSAYMRWMIDNDEDYQKHIKKQIKEEYGGSN